MTVQQAMTPYLARHAADCTVNGCAAANSGVIYAVMLIAFPLAVFGAAWLLLRLGFWHRAYAAMRQRVRYGFLADAGFGLLAVILFVLVRSPFQYWHDVWLGKKSGIVIKFPTGDPRFTPPTLLDKSINFVEGQFFLAFGMGILVAIAAPAVIWIARRAPRFLVGFAAICYLASQIVPAQTVWSGVYPLPDSPVTSDARVLAARAGVPFDRINLGFNLDIQKAEVTWHDGSIKVIMNEAMLNLLPLAPKNYSPPYKPWTAAEFRAVLGHELAHYSGYHWHWRVLALLILSLVLAGASWRSARRLVADRDGAAALERSSIAVTLVLFVATGFMLLAIVAKPAHANFSRFFENQADAAGLDLARDPDGMAQLALRFSRTSPLERREWYHYLYWTHPDSRTRLERAVAWKLRNRPDRWTTQGLSGAVRDRHSKEPFVMPEAEPRR